jgi:Enoyl-CoA hydratase/isomerase
MISVEELLSRAALDDEELGSFDVPLVVVDLSTASDVPATAVAPLESMPRVLVGFGAEDGPGLLGRALDVVTADVSTIDAIRRTVESAPRASVALVLLLRGRSGRTPDEALVAESMTYSMLQAGPEFASWRSARPSRIVPPDAERAVHWERRGSELRVTLNRPHRHNAYSSAMRDDLVAALRVALADPSLRVVLTGAGPSFSSGGDLDEFGSFPDPATAHLVRLTRSAPRLLVRIGERVEARVHGACLGAGVELAAFARRVVARSDSVFGLPELSLGLIPGAGGTASLPMRIGRQRTARLALTMEKIDVTTALRWGLVDELSDD